MRRISHQVLAPKVCQCLLYSTVAVTTTLRVSTFRYRNAPSPVSQVRFCCGCCSWTLFPCCRRRFSARGPASNHISPCPVDYVLIANLWHSVPECPSRWWTDERWRQWAALYRNLSHRHIMMGLLSCTTYTQLWSICSRTGDSANLSQDL
jgi:hypothetical protein